MRDIFISLFVLTALSLIFSHAWNTVAETMLSTWEIKDKNGNVKKPVIQTLVYAISITILAIIVLYFLHRFGLTKQPKNIAKK